jgi:epidermal growth factor receptor substrate 15
MSPPAYLTNPSENSFRAYLTEQSFRHHLSRLDDNSDDVQSMHKDPYPLHPSNRSDLITPSHCFIDRSPFYFANRASICLRTPKHVFHSFTLFTIAAMVPYSKLCDGEHLDAWMVSDAWYIGAFGKWWRGGALEAWYQDVITRSKGKGSWTSGILSMKPLEDILPGYTRTFEVFFMYPSYH